MGIGASWSFLHRSGLSTNPTASAIRRTLHSAAHADQERGKRGDEMQLVEHDLVPDASYASSEDSGAKPQTLDHDEEGGVPVVSPGRTPSPSVARGPRQTVESLRVCRQ